MSEATAEKGYSIGSLLTNAGTGSNGDKLIDAVLEMYPPELRSAQLKRPDPVATAKLDVMEVEKVVDVHEVHDAVVRGGTARADQAWVTFAGYDESGRTVKGCILLSDLEDGDTDSMVTQTDSLEDAEPQAEEKEKPLTKAAKAAAKKQAKEEAARAKAIEDADPEAAREAANPGDEDKPAEDADGASSDEPAESDPAPSDAAPAEGDSSPADGGEPTK